MEGSLVRRADEYGGQTNTEGSPLERKFIKEDRQNHPSVKSSNEGRPRAGRY